MKTHSPSRTYNPGDKCRVFHTVNGVTQNYAMESISTYKGEFGIAYFNNKSPRVWRLNSLDINGFVYPGDTIFVGNKGYKNTTQGIKLVREFIKEILPHTGNNTTIYAPDFQEYDVKVISNTTAGYLLKDEFPSFAPWSNTYQCALLFVGSTVYVKATNTGPVNQELRPDATQAYNRVAFYLGAGYTWGAIATPDTTYLEGKIYNLSNVEGDFYYFIIQQAEGVINIQKLALNTNP